MTMAVSITMAESMTMGVATIGTQSQVTDITRNLSRMVIGLTITIVVTSRHIMATMAAISM
jgi:hypothetical protein